MLEKLMAFCLRNRLTVIIITLVLAALSIFGIMRTPVDVFPELYVPRVTIQTEAGGQIEYGIVVPQCDYESLVQVFVIKSFEVVE